MLELRRSLENDEAVVLPEDFTKAVVTRAESSVSGLRKRSERIAAVGIVALLVLLAAAGFIDDIGRAAVPNVFGAAAGALVERAGDLIFASNLIVKKAFSGMAGVVGFAAVAAAIFVSGYIIARRARRPARDAG